jgi:hypothetical protein
MKKILKKIFDQPTLQTDPPVLIDIGASEELHSKWKDIAKYSFCIAFDADERDFQFVEKEKSKFRKLYIYNSIVTDTGVERTKFYLTKSPYCSSILKPNEDGLKPHIHSDLFKIEKIIEFKAIHIQQALDELGIKKVDWFKTDSQGTDLRLFKSFNDQIREKVIVAEFEPGIIDAYEGEDKLYSVLEYMTKNNFWLSEFIVKGVPRLSLELWNSTFRGGNFKKLVQESLKKSPGWGEMTFFNSFENSNLNEREYLLGWVFATIETQYSFAYTLATKGADKFKNKIFYELKDSSLKEMKKQVYKLKFIPSAISFIKKSASK